MGSDSYSWQARIYDLVLEPLNAPVRQVARGMVTVQAGSVVLDIGCGTGAALEEFRAAGCVVMGADRSSAMLDQARERLNDVELRLMSGKTVPFGDACADLVVVSLVLHSLDHEDATTLLAEAARVLRPNGRLLVTDFGAGGLLFPRGWWTRGLTGVAELAAGPTHARRAVRYLRAGGITGVIGTRWRSEKTKRVAGGNIEISVLLPD